MTKTEFRPIGAHFTGINHRSIIDPYLREKVEEYNRQMSRFQINLLMDMIDSTRTSDQLRKIVYMISPSASMLFQINNRAPHMQRSHLGKMATLAKNNSKQNAAAHRIQQNWLYRPGGSGYRAAKSNFESALYRNILERYGAIKLDNGSRKRKIGYMN
jgi:hypothetical protein